MRSRFWVIRMIAFSMLFTFTDAVSGVEKLDHGLVAVEREDGSVFLSWRLLDVDAKGIGYILSRRCLEGALEPATVLIHSFSWRPRPTNFVDKTAEINKTYLYDLRKSSGKWIPEQDNLLGRIAIQLTGKSKPYLSIPLKGDYDFQKVGIADLDGDGAYEYIIKQPYFNTDPYQQPGYWKKSTTTYKLEAYRLDGTRMWQYDMGWSIEAGIWYSPWIVYDADGDGKAEVYCKAGAGDPRDEKGLVQSGPEYLVKIDGECGKVVAKTAWLSRDGFSSYNYYCRNFLTVAYLNGETPSLIMQRGTYNLIKIQALDKNFNQLWYWEAPQEKRKYRGQSSHGLISADV
ncbi:MAG: hypothetical protein HQ580_02115, partial [Planctomycetes bacterium]|nr:hypothetical protein [Planctomycetota bacterium]